MKFVLILVIIMAFVPTHGALAEQTVKEISVSQVPLKIITAARKEIFAIKFTEAEIITQEDGEIVYELEGKKDGVHYVIQVNDKAKVLRSGLESDFESERKERNLSKLPTKVRDAVLKAKEGIKLVDFATEKHGYGMVTYEVEGILNGECYEIEINVQGDVLETEKCD